MEQVPTYYNIKTDAIEPVTQELVDKWCHLSTAYGQVRIATAKALLTLHQLLSDIEAAHEAFRGALP